MLPNNVETCIQYLMPEWSKRKAQNAAKKVGFAPNEELLHRVLDTLVNSTDTEKRSSALYMLTQFPKTAIANNIYHRDVKLLAERLLLDPNPPLADVMPRFFADSWHIKHLYDLWCRENTPHLLLLLQKPEFFKLLTPERSLRVLLMARRLADINLSTFDDVYLEFLTYLGADNSELAENAQAYLLTLPDEFFLTFQPIFFGTFNYADRNFADVYPYLLKAFRRSVGTPYRERLRSLLQVHDNKPRVIEQICEEWLETRAPELEDFLSLRNWWSYEKPQLDVFVALKVGTLENLKSLEGNLIPYLVAAVHDADSVIQANARALLENLPEKDLEQLAKIWLTDRLPNLYAIFVRRVFLPRDNPEARVRLALKMGRPDQLRLQPALIKVIAAACEDNDPEIAAAARRLLPGSVDRPARIQALLDAIFVQDLPFAGQLAIERDYVPEETGAKTLFYFLTGQFDRYESLDYDLRILKQTYEAANQPLRKRLARLVRQAGRTEYLTIIAGSNERSRAHILTAEEAEILVRNLARNCAWEKLWRLVFELPLHYSVQAIQKLSSAGFVPPGGEEITLFRRLQELANAHPLTTVAELLDSWKIIEPLNHFQLETQVHDIALAPDGVRVAVALDNFKIRIRRLSESEPDVIVDGFRRAPYHLFFINDEKLVCAESVPGSGLENATTSVYLWQKETRLKKIGNHTGSIYDFQMLDENLALSCGQDGNLALWNLRAGVRLEQTSAFKVRRLCVSTDRRWVVAVTALGYKIYSLPELQPLDKHEKSDYSTGFTIWGAALTPDETGLVISRPDTKMGFCAIDLEENFSQPANPSIVRQWVPNHGFALQSFGETYKRSRPVIKMFSFPETDWVVLAYRDGTLEFMEWATRKVFYRYNLPLGENARLTAIKFTDDKKQLLTGDSDGNVRIWNFRPVDLRRFFGENLVARRGTDLDFLANFERQHPDLPPSIATALQYIRLVLEHRARFEIELDDFVAIEASDFDIELAE